LDFAVCKTIFKFTTFQQKEHNELVNKRYSLAVARFFKTRYKPISTEHEQEIMLTIGQINLRDKGQVRRFVDIPYRLYRHHPQWVPPLRPDVELMLNKEKHPFYEHSDADFFIAVRDGRAVGRVAALVNRRFNDYHHTRQAQFYLFECEEDQEAADALFEQVFAWARAHGLNKVVGPKGFGALDGYGLLVEGFEHRQMMTMMNYNHRYYPRLVENLGFRKEVDFISCYLGAEAFNLPERVHSIAERVQKRGTLQVKRFTDKAELKAWADRIGRAYNAAFVNNWEYYPLTAREIKFILDNILVIADPKLIKVITHDDQAVGFLFGFHDVSAGLQRARGRLLPFGLLNIFWELRRTKWVALNGAGILPEFQGRGCNALLYAEMEKTIKDFGFEHADLTQVADTAVQMRSDLVNLGGKLYKTHRVYARDL
jgi:GNAT superfamily N-acetyltransferase